MDAESLVDEFAVRRGGHLAERGFETDEWKFRRYSKHRDALILAFQKSKLWSDEEAYFFINVYLSLHPVWEHERVADGLPDVLEQVLQQLGEVLPHYVGLLDRTELFGRLEELFGGRAWRLRGWLLAESGPSDELDQVLSERQGANSNDRGAADLIRDYAATKAQRS